MKIKVVTFRGYKEVSSVREAQRVAKDMILDIITDGIDSDYWWAQIYWYEKQVSRTWLCPQIGVWSYSPWVHIDTLFFDLYCS